MKMNKRMLFVILAVLMLLCACSENGGSQELVIYRLALEPENHNGRMLVPETMSYDKEEGMLSSIVDCLNAPAVDSGLTRAYPEGVYIQSCTLENGVASVYMSGDYVKLAPYDQTLANYAITYSLFMIDSVVSVDIICKTRLMADNLKPDLAALADVSRESCETIFKIFLPNESQTGLTGKTAIRTESAEETVAEVAVTAVLEEIEHMPENAVLRSLEINEAGRCRIELSSGLYQDMPKDANLSMLTIYSIVNTVCYLDGVEDVVILVNGEELPSYGGYITEWPMVYKGSLIAD